MNVLIDLNEYPVADVLDILLKDKTTKRNILFATESYESFGKGYEKESEITKKKLKGFDEFVIQPRVYKSLEAQKTRTKGNAEVMTPGWVVCKMNGCADEQWFGRPDVFEYWSGKKWVPREEEIEFQEGKTWKHYIDSKRAELACGEAPYIVSRYDVTTGEVIPIESRIGMLDRKLRIVNENAESEAEWKKWAERSLESVYGFEFQGDNLLIARINVLFTFVDFYAKRFGERPAKGVLRKMANIIVWNFWQMDGLTGTIPYAEPEDKKKNEDQMELGAFFDTPADKNRNIVPSCLIRDWRYCTGGRVLKYTDMRK